MILSPQMREYLRLLYLPIADLRQAVENALEENPILEEIPKTANENDAEPSRFANTENDEISGDESETSILLNNLDHKEPLSFTKLPRDFSKQRPTEIQKMKDFQETLITRPESLFDYLEWQMHFLELNSHERKIAEEIIGNINPEGYLTASMEEIATVTKSSPQEVLGILQNIQRFDPPGIGARNLQEALLIQLDRKGSEAALASEIVKGHMDLLAKKDTGMLAKIFHESEPTIRKALAIISRLEPKPGRSFYLEEAIAITPDATVSIKPGTQEGLEIEIHNDWIPEIRINNEYRQMIRDKNIDAKTKEFLRQRLTNGQDFLKALGLRKSTLQAITEEIVRAQPLFFSHGFSELRPLKLHDIAERLGLHDSTISRAIHGKYLKTPQGTIPYKSFFSQKVETLDGNEESQKSTMERIRAFIEKENPKKPLSDEQLVKLLKETGIQIARRTVAKYRENLKILPTHLRKQR